MRCCRSSNGSTRNRTAHDISSRLWTATDAARVRMHCAHATVVVQTGAPDRVEGSRVHPQNATIVACATPLHPSHPSQSTTLTLVHAVSVPGASTSTHNCRIPGGQTQHAQRVPLLEHCTMRRFHRLQIPAEEYAAAVPDPVAQFSKPICQHMNARHADSTAAMVAHYVGMEVRPIPLPQGLCRRASDDANALGGSHGSRRGRSARGHACIELVGRVAAAVGALWRRRHTQIPSDVSPAMCGAVAAAGCCVS